MKKDEVYIKRAPRNAQHPYMQLYRKVPQDLSLSLIARALLIYILSLPLTWIDNIVDMGRKNGIGRDKTRDLIKELEKAGYCKVFKRKVKGQFAGSYYYFSEDKQFDMELIKIDMDEQPEPEFQGVEENAPEPETPSLENQALEMPHGSLGENDEENAAHIILDTTSLKSKDIPPVPQMGECVCVDSFDIEIKEATSQVVEVIREVKPNFAVPKKKTTWHEAMRKTIVEDKRPLFQFLEVLRWALNDNEIRGDWNGWSSKILLSKNPIEYLRKRFDGIEQQSLARKYRTFLPSSDDNMAEKTLNELIKRGGHNG